MQSRCRGQRPYHFFKVVLSSNADDKKLKIPPKFVGIFGDELTAAATLTTPLVMFGRTSLHPCWVLLVFEYEGNSNFKISIFDLTTCEISYPCNPSNGSEKQYHGKRSSVHPEEEMEDDVSVEILGSSPPFQAPTSLKSAKTSFKSGLGIMKHGRNDDSFQSPKSKHVCFRESKKYKMDSQMFDHNQTESDEDDSVIEGRKEAKTRARTPSPERCGRTKGRERIHHAPRMSKPANPSFSVTMRPYNIESRFLNVPAAFAKSISEGSQSNFGILVEDSGLSIAFITNVPLFHSTPQPTLPVDECPPSATEEDDRPTFGCFRYQKCLWVQKLVWAFADSVDKFNTKKAVAMNSAGTDCFEC
ncbi:B3 domain-containing transcription factor VRN1 [Vitis vinifera]|uniref:B3 domain-containing transcription factor VRN1 n=1 Tax=Vitis vinifera TaxID=29760 RepID=A0A438FMA9_VITVI|nr:B3 domain-containing transcription factor VRN1 [Vitis vinifera]